MARQLLDDTVGNVLGERATYVYTTDGGVAHNMTQDAGNATGVGNVLSADADAPILRTSQARPIKPRYILVAGPGTGLRRKKVVIGSATNTAFNGTDSTVTINTVVYTIVTRVGERNSRLKIGAPE